MAAKSQTRPEYDSKVAADVTDGTRRRLKVLAAKEDVSMADIIREAIHERLDESDE